MKLLTTIAAVLISISAFSQDYVEYNEGTFSRNGEELSMEQIDDLTLLHKAGRGNVRRANRFNRMHKNGNLRNANNILNGLGGVVTGLYGVPTAVGGGFVLFDPDLRVLGLILLPVGTGLSVISSKAFSRIALYPERCLFKRDQEFNKVADKLNEAIQSSFQ